MFGTNKNEQKASSIRQLKNNFIRMKKVFMLMAVMLLGISTVAFSQMKYGVKAGLVSANQKWSAGGFSVSPDAKIGAVFGAFVKFDVAENFAVQPELLYVMKGAKMDGDIFETNEEVTLKLNYLSIPIMAKYYFGGFNLQAGPSFDFLLSAKGDDGGDEEDIKDELKGLDLGLAIGAGYDLSSGLGFDVRYVMGLTDINDSEDMEGIEMKNNCLMFTISYSF